MLVPPPHPSPLPRLVVMGLLLSMPKSIFRLYCIVWCCRAGRDGRDSRAAVLLWWWGYILYPFKIFFCCVCVCAEPPVSLSRILLLLSIVLCDVWDFLFSSSSCV
jgi:hypothetical protein